MSLKEKIAAATNAGSLKWTKSDEQDAERAVDRVSALALAQVRTVNPGIDARAQTREGEHLASCLWKLKYGGDHSKETYGQVLHGVCARVHGRNSKRAPSDLLRAVVAIAIEEWRVESCPVCRRRKYVGGVYEHKASSQETKARVCPSCSGAGTRERTDEERAQAVMGLLRSVERDRVARTVRRICNGLVVSAIPVAIPNMRVLWSRGWADKYRQVLEVVVGLDARLGSKIKRKLGNAGE